MRAWRTALLRRVRGRARRVAARLRRWRRRQGRDLSALRAILKQKPDLNATDPDGTTALHWAARVGDAQAIDVLLRAGEPANVANRYGVTPLSLAADNGDAPTLARLLDAGASIRSAETAFGGTDAADACGTGRSRGRAESPHRRRR